MKIECMQVIRSYHGHLSGVYCLALHPTLDILMTGGRDSVCRVYYFSSSSLLCILNLCHRAHLILPFPKEHDNRSFQYASSLIFHSGKIFNLYHMYLEGHQMSSDLMRNELIFFSWVGVGYADKGTNICTVWA